MYASNWTNVTREYFDYATIRSWYASPTLASLISTDFRISDLGDEATFEKYRDILHLFLDTPNSTFSIQNIAVKGQKFDKTIGSWFGPSTIAYSLSYAYLKGF